MKQTFRIIVKYGWSKYELENYPYRSVNEIEADSLEEAIKIETTRLNKPQFADTANPNGYPFYWELPEYNLSGTSGI